MEENIFRATLPYISSQTQGLQVSSFHQEDRGKLLPQIFRMAEKRLHDRQSFMISAASRYYYYYLIHLYNRAISKEVHSPPRLTIINKIIPKQGEKKLFDIVLDCNFLDMTPQAQATEAKVNKQDYTQVSIESLMLSNHIILCHPLLLLLSIFSSIMVFSSELALCIW